MSLAMKKSRGPGHAWSRRNLPILPLPVIAFALVLASGALLAAENTTVGAETNSSTARVPAVPASTNAADVSSTNAPGALSPDEQAELAWKETEKALRPPMRPAQLKP